MSDRFRFVKLRDRPISAVLVEAALTGFAGNISIAGSTAKEPIAIDIYVEEGVITHCAGYLGNREVSGDECLDIIMSVECVNCGVALTKLPPDRVIRKHRRPILVRELTVSDRIDGTSRLLRESVSAAEIVLKGRMMLFVKAEIDRGLRALAELSAVGTSAMIAASGDSRLVIVSSRGRVTAAYLKLDGEEYLGQKALDKASHRLGEYVLIQIYALPDEIARIFSESTAAKEKK